MTLDDEETAIVLAALRYAQTDPYRFVGMAAGLHFRDLPGGLSADPKDMVGRIDSLCEKINFDEPGDEEAPKP